MRLTPRPYPRRMRVSAIVPTYRRPNGLRHALASLRAQGHADWEAIVVDDGDGEGLEALRGWGDPRVVAFRNPGRGQVDARNWALEAARGEVVLWLDYMGFGSDIVVPGTGIALQNRGAGFATEPGHPNRVAGGKRPFHTIVPAFLTQNGRPLAAFGVIGGHVQAQMHVQLVVRLRDHGQNLQAAIDAPRWHLDERDGIVLERDVDGAVVDRLRELGHRVRVDDPAAPAFFGGAQMVWRLPDGGYVAASDGRREGLAVGF